MMVGSVCSSLGTKVGMRSRLMKTCAMRGRSSPRPVSFSTIDARMTILASSNPSDFFSSATVLACAARSSAKTWRCRRTIGMSARAGGVCGRSR